MMGRGADNNGNNDDDLSFLAASRVPGLGSAWQRQQQQQQQQRNARGSGGGGSGGGASPGEHDLLYPGGFSEDGVRAPLPAVTDRLIGGSGGGGSGGGGGGAMLGGMLRGSMAGGVGAGGGSVEEKDNADWIFEIPEVCWLILFWLVCV